MFDLHEGEPEIERLTALIAHAAGKFRAATFGEGSFQAAPQA